MNSWHLKTEPQQLRSTSRQQTATKSNLIRGAIHPFTTSWNVYRKSHRSQSGRCRGWSGLVCCLDRGVRMHVAAYSAACCSTMSNTIWMFTSILYLSLDWVLLPHVFTLRWLLRHDTPTQEGVNWPLHNPDFIITIIIISRVSSNGLLRLKALQLTLTSNSSYWQT